MKKQSVYLKYGKRILDVAAGAIGLLAFAAVFVIFAPLIHFTDGGPVFYTAERLGIHGRKFKMYKFRSMYVNSPNLKNKDGSTYNADDDPRVTKVGRVMRKTSLDETAQVLNVLRGDMSVIGPRPFLATSFRSYDELDEKRKKRLDVRPGITGYSQAYYRNSISTDQKIENDCYYVDHVSFGLDIKILLHTVFSVLKRENVFVSPELKGQTTIADGR